MVSDWLWEIPIWVWAPVIFGLLKISYLAGLWLGRRSRVRRAPDELDDRGQVTLGAMLALLGLLLAFTYSFALNRFEDRKIALLDETNAIGTAFQWAELTAEPGRTELQRRLLDYAKTRVVSPEIGNDAVAIRQAIKTSLAALKQLWPAAKAAVGEPPYGPVQASTAASVIVVGDVGTARLTAGYYHIPPIVLVLLLLVMSLAILLLAYGGGRWNTGSVVRANAFMVVLSALLVVILDFDRARSGFIQLDELSLHSLIADMERELDAR